MKKQILQLSSILMLTISFFALQSCGDGSNSEQKDASAETTEAAPPPAAKAECTDYSTNPCKDEIINAHTITESDFNSIVGTSASMHTTTKAEVESLVMPLDNNAKVYVDSTNGQLTLTADVAKVNYPASLFKALIANDVQEIQTFKGKHPDTGKTDYVFKVTSGAGGATTSFLDVSTD